MPTNRITMRRIKEVSRRHLQAGLNYSEVGRMLKVSKSVVAKCVARTGSQRRLTVPEFLVGNPSAYLLATAEIPTNAFRGSPTT
jgi:transposase